MLKEEFIERTGFAPTDEEYAEIERSYYAFNGLKDEFCKQFSVASFKAEMEFNRIEKACKDIKEMKAETSELRELLREAREELEREQEWRPSDSCGTKMNQRSYEYLAKSGRKMTDDEAKTMIYEEFGFGPSMIEIVREVSTLEVHRHRRLRTTGTFKRSPYYEASDWNYIRFNVKAPRGTWQWEVINGDITQYED